MDSPKEPTILIVDDDPSTDATLAAALLSANIGVDTARDGLSAIEKLRRKEYAAVVISPLIRHRLNGFVVLSFLEQEQPSLLPRVFLLTVLPEETIQRIAPAMLRRRFKKADDALVRELIAVCGAEASEHRRGSASVLLAEDDAETARIESEMLRELGYSCHWVADGSDVMAAIKSGDFDALLLDVVMPDMDGTVVLKSLQAINPEWLRRVIVVTGLPKRYLDVLDDYQVCGVIQKPIDARSLRKLLEKCA